MAATLQHRQGAKAGSGFSLVELAVVLLLLGILVVVGANRLSQTHDQAFSAHVESLAGSLRTALSKFHANWKLRQGTALNVPGWGDGTLDANDLGLPVGARRDVEVVGTHQDCEDVWLGLLQDAPAVTAANPDKESGTSYTHIESKLGSAAEWVAGRSPVIDDATIRLPPSAADGICQFISLHHQSVQAGSPKPTIFYDTRTGVVLTDLERVF